MYGMQADLSTVDADELAPWWELVDRIAIECVALRLTQSKHQRIGG
jgi:hypothetical protein